MSNLKRINDSMLVQLNSLDEDDILKLSSDTLPQSLLNENIIKIDEYKNIDLQIDEKLILDYLLENIDDDAKCAIKIFQEFKRIDELTLLDNKMWGYYSLNEFYEYTYNRFLKDDKTVDTFKRRGLLIDSTINGLTSNSISRLYWISSLTRNTKNSDIYEITRYVFDNQIFLETLFKLSVFSTPKFVHKFFEAYKLIDDSSWECKKEDKEFVIELKNYLENLSVFSLLDLYDVAQLLNLIVTFYEEYYN